MEEMVKKRQGKGEKGFVAFVAFPEGEAWRNAVGIKGYGGRRRARGVEKWVRFVVEG